MPAYRTPGVPVSRRRLTRALGLIAALSTVAAIPTSATAATCAYRAAWGTPDRAAAAEVVGLVNEHRAGLGLTPLVSASVLVSAAEWKSGHMAANGYFSHEDAGIIVNGRPRTFGERVGDCGVPGGAGENIAAGQRTPPEVMRGWLNSPGHRRNIERPGYRSIGVGVVSVSGGRINWTQVFSTEASIVDGGGSPAPPVPAPVPEPTPSPTPAPTPAPAPPALAPEPDPPTPGAASPLPGLPAGAKVLRPGRKMGARRGLRARGKRALRFGMAAPSVVRVAVKVRSRSGRRPIVVRLRCNGRTLAAARGRRGKIVVLTRRVPAGECRVVVQAGRQRAAVAILAKGVSPASVARIAPARPDLPPATR